MRRELGRLLWIALCYLSTNLSIMPRRSKVRTYLSNERDKLPEVLCLLVRVEVEDLADAVVVVPLLEELLLVCRRVPLDEVLQLRQVRRQQYTATHFWRGEVAGVVGSVQLREGGK